VPRQAQTRRRNASGKCSETARVQLRQALWSSYFHRFYGGRHKGYVSPVFAPITLDGALEMLQTMSNATPVNDRPRRDLVRRCVSQMLLCGHQPDLRFKDMLVDSALGVEVPSARKRAAPPVAVRRAAADDDEQMAQAKDRLVSWGEQEFDVPGALQRRTPSLEEQLGNAGPGQNVITLPTQIVHRGDAYTAEKEGYFRLALRDVETSLNPVNWHQLGAFFLRTERERPDPGPKSHRAPWQGVLAEDFAVDWNGFNTYVFRQKLKIDYIVAPDVVRADYSLMYEQDDQIELNEGFFDARPIQGAQGWIHSRMSKTVRFSSSILNLLAPAILAMYLDDKTAGFTYLIETRIGAPRSRRQRR